MRLTDRAFYDKPEAPPGRSLSPRTSTFMKTIVARIAVAAALAAPLLIPATASATVPSQPRIAITKTDGRDIHNLSVWTTFFIDGKAHYAKFDIGDFNMMTTIGLNAHNGTWTGTYFAGNFLYSEGSKTPYQVWLGIDKAISSSDSWDDPGPVPQPEIEILNEDGRDITGMRVYAEFTIDGATHYDYEDIGVFDHMYGLTLNGANGTWTDGWYFSGNFLATQYSGYETQMDPGLMSFLDALCIICQGGTYLLGESGGSGWTFRQLM
jgi:hypothetical protein